MTMHYVAAEQGTHELPDGTRILVGAVTTSSQQHGAGVSGSESWATVNFADWPGAGSPLPGSQVFTYDANGNRESIAEDSNLYNYSNQIFSNRLSNTAGPSARSFTYDAAGNTLSDGVHSYGYDDRGRLVSVDSGTVTYQHNGQGQRVLKNDGTATLFVYDEAGQLLGEYDAAGNAIQETVWFAGAPVAVAKGSSVYYVHTDHLGTPRAITSSGTVIWRWESDAFGSTAAQEDPDGDQQTFTYNLRFPGQYFDGETGVHYNYFRTYDPSTGRYLESDPIGLLGGLNTYAYAAGNPLSFFDPLGLEIVGQWVQRPNPFVSDASVEFGKGNARRPDDWWKIWRNLGTYKAMEHRVSVKAGFYWKVKCTDTEECSGSGDSWNIDGGWEDWMDVWVPVSTPAIPHPGGYYAFLARNTYSLLIRPATNQAMEQMTQAANAFGALNAPTWICKSYPRPGN